ncbi:MAG: peptidoglycan DD-metalloendopeptidase family protein, partial [Chloroflexi bacterium]|nr:peptidoglycan DD-metalloendopeptidase family protein [Chloroflexota bacterium]
GVAVVFLILAANNSDSDDPDDPSDSAEVAENQPPVISGDAVAPPDSSPAQQTPPLSQAEAPPTPVALVVPAPQDAAAGSEESGAEAGPGLDPNDQQSLVPPAPDSAYDAPPTAASNSPTSNDPTPVPTPVTDAIEAALLRPVAVAASDGVVQRANEPFTRRAATRSNVVQYTVQDGDSLESIATQFGLSDIYSIIWANPLNKVNPLRPGVVLNIMPEDGVYLEMTETKPIADIAAEYGVDPYTIIDSEYNNLFGSQPDTLLTDGMAVVIPGGETERMILLPPNPGGSSGGGGGDGSGVVSGPYSLWGCSATISGGTMPYSRPLEYYTWMRGFSTYHTGVDIAANAGTPVYAAGAGTVVYAGYKAGGYGNVVVIAHGSTFSLYAHMLRPGVSCNQSVSQGQVIGTVGSTGNSSGNHLHFEVRDANFNPVNPEGYMGF